jgi:hypothetical protein
MIFTENNQEFIFLKDNLKTIAPANSKIYVVIQDLPVGKVVAHARILAEDNSEISFNIGGEVPNVTMSAPDVLDKAHNYIIELFLILNPTVSFVKVV